MFELSWVVVGYKQNVDIEALMNSIINGIYLYIEESTVLHRRSYSQHSHRDHKQKQRERKKQWLEPRAYSRHGHTISGFIKG